MPSECACGYTLHPESALKRCRANVLERIFYTLASTYMLYGDFWLSSRH